jgi:class 3 adenylate cyclase
VEAERRQVTVLFADMVGFTAFSDRAGEEAAFGLMQNLAKLMEDAVRQQGGAVQSFTGDGIMAVFGAPVAFEDASLRACRAAVAILEKVKSAGDDLEAKHAVRPQMRIGLNSGPAVMGKVQGGSDSGVTVLGDTVNLAARLQALAEPDSIVMSGTTHRLVDGLVEARFAGEHQIKGKSEAQKAYRLDGVRERAARFDAKIQRGLTRYVGRDRELEKLERGLDAIGGAGVQVFDIVGEPGIGKSRLLHEFLGQLVKDRARVLTGSCTPDGQQTPFRAFIEIVRGAFRLSPSDGEAVVARKFNEGLQGLGLRSQEALGLLLNLLGLKPPEGALEGLDGVLIGLRTRKLLQRLAQARSRLTPLVLVFEDLHWIDSASEDLLGKIVAIDEPLQLLILHTRRPEYVPTWASQPRVTRLAMEPLSARETARIAEARLGVDHLPEVLAKLITAKAEGNALFAEEIASFLLERGIVRRSAAGLDFATGAAATALPESLETLLASRVDRLAAPDRTLLQTAAVFGRRFDPDLVAVVVDATEGAPISFAAMEALDLIHRAEGASEYVFKHALVRDALYNGLLRPSRSALHLKVAEELERRGGNRLTEIAEALAHHYTETPRADKAFTYLAMAGDKSLDVYSITEAEQYYRRALTHVESHAGCADRPSVSRVMGRLLETLLLKGDYREIGVVSRKFIPYIRDAGEETELTIAYFYQATSFYMRLELWTALEITNEALLIADRLNFGRGRAYNLQGLVHTDQRSA